MFESDYESESDSLYDSDGEEELGYIQELNDLGVNIVGEVRHGTLSDTLRAIEGCNVVPPAWRSYGPPSYTMVSREGVAKLKFWARSNERVLCIDQIGIVESLRRQGRATSFIRHALDVQVQKTQGEKQKFKPTCVLFPCIVSDYMVELLHSFVRKQEGRVKVSWRNNDTTAALWYADTQQQPLEELQNKAENGKVSFQVTH